MTEITIRQQKNTLRMAVVTAFITTFMGSALNLSVPALEEQFQVSAALVGWVVTAFTLTVAAFSVPMGKLADATGRRRVLLIGIASFGVLSVLCIFSVNIWMMILFRGLQGVAASMIYATNNALLISVFPGTERGRVLGISTAATYVGLSMGPVIGGILNHRMGWQSIFAVTFFCTVLSFVLAWAGAPKTKPDPPQCRTDAAGNLLFIAMISLILYGLTNLTISRYGWLILVCGLALAAAFILVEQRAEDPVIRLTMFTRDRVFAFSNLAALLNYGATFAISYLVSIYLQVVMGYSSQTASVILICMPAVQALFSPLMGRLSDRVPPYKLASLGMGLCVAGLGMFSLLGLYTPFAWIIAALVVEGFGFALFSSPNTNAIMNCVNKEEYSVANSILATMRTFGHSASMAIVTIVVGMGLGNAALTEAAPSQLVKTMHWCFLVFVALCVIGTVLSLERKR